ncbi:MAG: hypothetical protein KatS3mg105_2425 [Gemmatales bacterium]|nr:MAG: hypothetical protein KatS3mg105_2425 [Gemmatales bacterium]
MDEPREEEKPARWGRSDVVAVLCLMAISSVIHAWQIAHTTVAARDSIGFIRFAWELEHENWLDVLRRHRHPPLYPLTILAVSMPFRSIVDWPEAFSMQYSAQLATALAGVLLVIPMYSIGRILFDRRVGFWGSLLFQCLPVGSRALSDGLTEGLYLLLLATIVLLSHLAVRRGSIVLFGVCGLCGGLAYLTRPEGAMSVVATGVLLAICSFRRDWISSRWRLVGCAASLLVGAAATASPYMIAIGGITNKTSSRWILEKLSLSCLSNDATRGQREVRPETRTPGCVNGRFAIVPVWGAFRPNWTKDDHHGNLPWAVLTFVKELGKAFHYVALLPAVFGWWWFREWFRRQPVGMMLAILFLFQALMVLTLGVVAGYMSERHMLLFVLGSSFFAVAAIFEFARRFCTDKRRCLTERLLLSFLIVCALPSALKTMHSSRAGFREAGLWLAKNANPADEIVDPFCWSAFYAERTFRPRSFSVPEGYVPKRFVVLDTAHHEHQPLLEFAKMLAKKGMVVYEWQRSAKEARVLVFMVPDS